MKCGAIFFKKKIEGVVHCLLNMYIYCVCVCVFILFYFYFVLFEREARAC